MKLKPVVASLIVLGLMTPVFAKGYHHRHHIDGMSSQQATIDQNNVTSPVCPKGWFDRITVSGVGEFDAIVGNRDVAGTYTTSPDGKNTGSDLYLNNFNVLVNATLNEWSKVTLNMGVLGAPILWNHLDANSIGNRNEAGFNGLNINTGTVPFKKYTPVADEVYVTFANLAKSPFYVKIGKGYIPFGEYSNPYTPIQIMSPAQMLAQTNATAAIAGVASDFGLYADVFGFRGETSPADSSTGAIRNFGARVGYYGKLSGFDMPRAHINVAMSYIKNLWDSQVFSPNAEPQYGYRSPNIKQGHPAFGVGNNYQIDPVGGVSAHADFAYGPFSVYADWVAAVKNMVNSTYNTSGSSSKFWGANVNAEYAFDTLGRNSFVGLGGQWSGNGNWFGNNAASNNINNTFGNTNGIVTDFARIIPAWRITGEYQVNIFKNTDIGLVVAHGKGYASQVMTTAAGIKPMPAQRSTLALARLMVQF